MCVELINIGIFMYRRVTFTYYETTTLLHFIVTFIRYDESAMKGGGKAL